MDAFFAAIEQRERPELQGKPVVVGADPKGGSGRGVVSTASYEARKFGIHSAQPISIAYRKCPRAFFLPVNFPLYEKVSQNIMSILRSYADKLEVAGMDEAYLDVSIKVQDFAAAKIWAMKIGSAIFAAEKLSCSIGVGPNKLIAKIASDFKKPRGITVVLSDKVLDFLASLPVEKIPGIGPKSKEVLNQAGVITIADLRQLSGTKLHDLFGKWGEAMYDLSRGIDESELIEIWEAKSVGREYTFEYDTLDQQEIFSALHELAEETASSLKEEKLKGKTIVLKVRYQGFETHTKQKTLNAGTDDLNTIKTTAQELLKPYLAENRKLRLIGIRLTKLTASE